MFKPYELVRMTVPVSTRKRIVQVISNPIGDGNIMVRMVPGEPTTMVQVAIADLEPVKKGNWPANAKWLHVARINSVFSSFPEDMLRYDCCFLFDHTIDENDIPPDKCHVVLIYTVSENKRVSWHFARWQSFSCDVTPVRTTDLREAGAPLGVH